MDKNDLINKVRDLLYANGMNSQYSVSSVSPSRGHSDLFDIRIDYTWSNSIPFDELDKLSRLFDTKSIDIERIDGSGGGCDSCGYGADEGSIEINLYEATV
ncbi:MAG TPA: hypothetical protein VHD33_03970 [Legionellaceae bacterium]|nr:hypothetical protein [Legionellaceae bacterium]